LGGGIQGQEAIRKAMGGFDIENFGVSRTGSAYSNEAFKGTGNACSLLICALRNAFSGNHKLTFLFVN
jgi:hypothetical protein